VFQQQLHAQSNGGLIVNYQHNGTLEAA